jgi:flagellar biosynthesis protein FlhG
MPTATLKPNSTHSLGEQARGLRALIERSHQPRGRQCVHARTVAFASGKGGVGKSVLALNLAITLAEQGLRVGLLDANPGLGHLDLLCQRNGYWNLSHVLAGARQLDDVLLDGPAGITLLPGANSLMSLTTCPDSAHEPLLAELTRFEAACDFLVLDAGPGLPDGSRPWLRSADDVLIVTTPEPTAIADAYALLKSLSGAAGPALHVVVNRAAADQAARVLERIQHTAHTFLKQSLTLGAGVPDDGAVARSVCTRRPFVVASPDCPASRAVQQLARQLIGRASLTPRDGFFTRLSSCLAGGAQMPRP